MASQNNGNNRQNVTFGVTTTNRYMPLEREGYVQNPNTSIQRPVIIAGQSIHPNQSTLSMDDKFQWWPG